MNLLNRYLQAVGSALPKARRDDIIAELRANILSQMEDREQELGRPLTEDEQVEILQHHGNPLLVAGQYREDNLGLAFGRRLIGPELFPFYRTVLLLNMAITVMLAVVIPAVARAAGGAISPARMLLPLAVQFLVITLLFILLDRYRGQVFDNWNTRKLPELKGQESREHTIFGFLAKAVGTLWMALAPRWPFLILGPGAWYRDAVSVKLMPRWSEFYWAIIALLCASLVLEFFVLFRSLSPRRARIIDLILRGSGLALGTLLLLAGPDYVTSDLKQVADWTNFSFLLCIAITLAINLWGLISLIRERDQMLPARQY